MQASVRGWVVVVGFVRAFDRVACSGLLCGFSSCGVKENTLGLISSFLSGRTQRVVVEGGSSSSFPLLSSVPQGSVFGLALFLICMGDLL